jgi:very-short-patch-repair endonuclease
MDVREGLGSEPRTSTSSDVRDPAALARAKQVFSFLKAFAQRNVPVQRTLAEQLWSLTIRSLPRHPTITVSEVRLAKPGDVVDSGSQEGDSLIRVRRPILTPPPRPPRAILDFLRPGWEQPEGSIEVLPARNIQRRGETISEAFADDPGRVTALNEWRVSWTQWREAETPARQAMKTFERFYELRGRIELESERVELMLGDGRLRWQRQDGPVDHPILLQRVELEFDPDVPEFRILDADRAPELYGALLQGGEAMSAEQLNRLRLELEKGGYHPLSRDGTSGYLKRLAQLLGPRGVFSETFTDVLTGADPRIIRDPVLFLRTRASGYPAAFDRVLQDLEKRQQLPVSLTRLVGVEPPMPSEAPPPTTSPWSEPHDVLLSKPANPEQVQIARALDRHRAVLVQGPPGTGKSHTIANLIGHLVAHGKRVLVTSHATKALRVLRGQIVETLQPLCVALLENDLEGRTQMEQAVRGILSRLTSSTESELEHDVARLAEARSALNATVERLTSDLRAAREAEYTPILIAGEAIDPAEAARWIKSCSEGNNWIPGPVESGAPVPLSADEVRDLYATSGRLTKEEEDEIGGELPSVGSVPNPQEFTELVEALTTVEPPELTSLWRRPSTEEEIDLLEYLRGSVRDTAAELARHVDWQRAVIAAGHAGKAEQELWTGLNALVMEAAEVWERARPELMEHEVELLPELPRAETRRVVDEIVAHLEAGGSLGMWTLLHNGKWKPVIHGSRVNGSRPGAKGHFRAIAIYLEVEEVRRKLALRWARQAEPIGLPPFLSLGTPPEPIARDYSQHFASLLGWWHARWTSLEVAALAAGFRWDEFRTREVARSAPKTPFERDAEILSGPFDKAVSARLAVAQRSRCQRRLRDLAVLLDRHSGPVCRALRGAVSRQQTVEYETAYAAFRQILEKQAVSSRRAALLEKLARSAPGWMDAIRRRERPHDQTAVPGDLSMAWRWRQLRQEIDRRASLDEAAISRRLHERRDDLRAVTVDLIDRRAWLGQLRRTDLNARQALQGWAATQKKIGRGTGKRVPELQAHARALLAKARDAVPVWIMPLARVAESFDPTQRRFDVVIVDEASQSDVLGLLAWYLGDRVAVVGDHEQVSPLGVGQQLDAVKALISEHLVGIPNSHLYDGTTSIYDLARMSFGGTIALREHFRCVPDIIEFSNELSYSGEIRPLRDSGSAPRPHVVEYVVSSSDGGGRSGKTNRAEAQAVVALLKATTELPENADKTVGAITLLGDEQSAMIQDLAVSVVGAVELERRRFVAGNSAQFQGDERHIMFLSMVDAPTGGLLPLRQTDVFKQRYNVAASRAKDQLWLVHSLDPGRDLKAGDLRRRLIEHVRAPGARRRAAQTAQRRAESPFELAVIERLIAAGYRVKPQVWIGHYRVDMVITDGVNQVVLECDGDRFHGFDQIPLDMIRQANLERVGWRFVRIRGTRFFRDPDGSMDWATGELRRLGVQPVGPAPDGEEVVDAKADAFTERVVRRAWEIMHEQGWVTDPEAEEPTLGI